MNHLLDIRSNRRVVCLVIVLFVSVLVLSACGGDDASGPIGGGSDAALSVNDFTLTVAEFNDQLDEWAKLFPGEQTAGTGEGTYAMTFVSGRASVNVQFEALIDALATAGIEVTAEHLSAAQLDTEEQLEQVKTQVEAGGAEYVAPSDEFIATLSSWTAANFAGIDHVTIEPDVEVTEADIEAAYEQYPESICSAHILVDTKKEAREIVGLLDGGDFATLAQERSTDTGSGAAGGDLGCVPEGTFVPEFENAALAATPGEVTDPVKSEFGFHLILVSSVEVPPLEDVREEIAAELGGPAEEAAQEATQAAFTEFLSAALEAADVKIDPRYGSWDVELGEVVPPEGSTPETSEAPLLVDPALVPDPAPVPLGE